MSHLKNISRLSHHMSDRRPYQSEGLLVLHRAAGFIMFNKSRAVDAQHWDLLYKARPKWADWTVMMFMWQELLWWLIKEKFIPALHSFTKPGEYVCDVCVYVHVCACYLCYRPHRTAPSHHLRLSGTSQETLRILGISCVTQDKMSSSKWKFKVACGGLLGESLSLDQSRETDEG